MAIEKKSMRVRLTFAEEVLGTASSDEEVYSKFIASKAPDAPSREEEIAAIGVDEAVERSTTVFPRDGGGAPILYDYQVKGMFKDACGMLRRVSGSESSKLTAYKKVIDGVIFIEERAIPFTLGGGPVSETGVCQRPLRASTAQGERIALASSETVPAGSQVEFTVSVLDGKYMKYVEEWLDYGSYRGLLQWRNSGKGRFTWEKVG